MTLAPLLAFALLQSPGTQYYPTLLDPANYSSEDGRLTYRVDPSSPYGRGPATYSLTQDGELLWTCELDFTLHEAVVAPDWSLIGYGLGKVGGGSSDIVVAAIDTNGLLRWIEHTERRMSRMVHGGLLPRLEASYWDHGLKAYTLCLFDPEATGPPRAWKRYGLEKGNDPTPFAPSVEEPFRGSWRYGDVLRSFPVQAQSIPETDLRVVAWRVVLRDSEKALGFTVVDPNGRVVWERFVPNGFERESAYHRSVLLALDLGLILDSPGPRQFEVWLLPAEERVTFEVRPSPDPPTASSIREVHRAPWSYEVATGLSNRTPLERVELDRLESVALARPRTAEAGSKQIGEPERLNQDSRREPIKSNELRLVTVLPDGPVVALRESTGRIYTWSLDGALLFEGDPVPPESRTGRHFEPLPRVTRDPKGAIWIQTLLRRYRGWRVDGTLIEDEPRSRHIEYIPFGEVTWDNRAPRSVLEVSNVHLAGSFERLPNGQWLDRIVDVTSSADGSVIVLNRESRHELKTFTIAVLPLNGRSPWMVELAGLPFIPDSVQCLEQAVLVSGWTNQVVLLDLEDRSLSTATVSDAAGIYGGSSAWRHGLASGGRQLLSVRTRSLKLYRTSIQD